GGNVLTLVSTGDVQVQSGALLSGTNVSAISSNITFVGAGATPPATGMVIDAATLAQLAQSQSVNLQSYGDIAFDGNVDIQMNSPSATLTLGAGTFSDDGGQVTIAAPTLVLDNTMGASALAAPGTGSLGIDVGQLIFSTGAEALSGFGSVSLAAHQAVIGQGTGSMDFGGLTVTLQTPTLIAGTASEQTLTTTGALSVVPIDDSAPIASDALGGAITLQGGSVNVAVPVQAQGGNISLQASAGDVIVAATGALISHGLAKQFNDTTAFASGGAITLSADQGTVDIEPGALIDFSGALSGGNGGSLAITTTGSATSVQLDGTLLGTTAAGGAGSNFSLNTAAAADLDNLAQVLTSAGITGGISVQTGQGDLTLNGTLTASQVALVANAGTVTVNGAITANGTSVLTGEIDLYGTAGVDVEGSLVATGSPNSQKPGGIINIGTTGTGSTTSLNSTYGYENVDPSASGTITVGANALIHASGGTVTLRAPILDAENAQGMNVNLSLPAAFAPGKGVFGGTVDLEVYAVWSTADQSTNPAQHFDG
ncbi:MAG TPA: hypothetical protein VGC05_21760, partial [Mycobacterium sp.]